MTGGELTEYLNRTFSATLRHPNRTGITLELDGAIAPNRELLFPRMIKV
jgi:hypothetical protein